MGGRLGRIDGRDQHQLTYGQEEEERGDSRCRLALIEGREREASGR
jgi:hypothetical protein